MAIDPTDLLRRLAARRAEADPLGLTAGGGPAPTLDVPPPLAAPRPLADADPLGLAAEPFALPLPADPGPRAPAGVTDPGRLTGGGFATNAPENPLPLGSQQAALRERVAALDAERAAPSWLDRVLAVNAKLVRANPKFQLAQQEADQQAQAQRLQALSVLVGAAEKIAEQPELGAAFKPLLQQAAKAAGVDLDPETFDFVTETKGAATTLAIDSDLVDASPYVAAVRRVPKSQKATALKTMQEQIEKDAEKVVGQRITSFLAQQAQIRTELAAAGKDAPAKVQDLVLRGFPKEFDRQAAFRWLDSEAGDRLLRGYGIQTARGLIKDQERPDKPGALSQPVRDVLRGAPYGLKDPDAEATPAQIAEAERLVSARKDERARILGTAKADQQPLPAETAERIGVLEAMLTQVDEVMALHQDAYTGPVRGRVAGVSESVTGNIADEEIEFRAIVRSLQEDLLRAKSGAAITEKEYARLLGFLPDVTNPSNVFKSRVRRFKKQLQITLEAKRAAAGLTRGDMRGPRAAPAPAPVRQVIGEPEEIE